MNLRTQLARLKRRLFAKPFLKDERFPPFWMEQVFGGRKASVIQIGSNDGKTGDPLHTLLHKNQQWEALFVEPVPYLFERLKGNYTDTKRFRFENAAIGKEEKLTFYWVDPAAKEQLTDLPYWYDQLGSFNKQHITTELGDRMEPFILSAELESIGLTTLLDRHHITTIDILHIDTEGHDWNILSQLDLEGFQPTFILFEANHLSEDDLSAAIRFLGTRYELYRIGIDMLAVAKDVDATVRQKMARHMSHPNNSAQ